MDAKGRQHQVVINHEEQYSIWPADQQIPTGWKAAGPSGSKDSCFKAIEKLSPGTRPVDLRP